MKSIGTLIRDHRLAKGLTQEALGSMVFVSKQAVSKWETGKTLPNIEMVRKLCDILDISSAILSPAYQYEASMAQYDEKLEQLQGQIIRTTHLQARLQELRKQREQLEPKVRELERIKHDEQSDVDRLEGRNLTSLFYYIVGKKGEKLSKERIEAYSAQVKYNSAKKELAEIISDIEACHAELIRLRNCKAQYASVFKEKTEAIKSLKPAAATRILQLEEQRVILKNQQKELQEAIYAGQAAHNSAVLVSHTLKTAENWGTYDLLGGGLWADLEKHSKLDQAQAEIEQMQRHLRLFKTELADICVSADIKVTVSDFLYFADFFFDSLFTDLAVMEKINNAQEQIQQTKKQISAALDDLNAMQRSVIEALACNEGKLTELVLGEKA